jgi:hypothetical protein
MSIVILDVPATWIWYTTVLNLGLYQTKRLSFTMSFEGMAFCDMKVLFPLDIIFVYFESRLHASDGSIWSKSEFVKGRAVITAMRMSGGRDGLHHVACWFEYSVARRSRRRMLDNCGGRCYYRHRLGACEDYTVIFVWDTGERFALRQTWDWILVRTGQPPKPPSHPTKICTIS